MYISPSEFVSVFDDIRKSSLSHSACKVVIFVSCLDIDALCAAKIISNVFKTELIPHKLVPVVGYKELKAMFSELDEAIINVICIGCGGTIDLEEYFDISPEEIEDEHGNVSFSNKNSRKIYVIDNHRPWNLDNLFGTESVICFDDGKVDENLTEHKLAYEFLSNEDDDGEEEEDDDENDTDADPDPGASGNGKGNDENKENENIDSDGGDTDIDEEDPDNNNDISNNNSISGDPPSNPSSTSDSLSKQAKAARKQIKSTRSKYTTLLENYYNQGTFVHSSSTTQIYTLLSLIGQTSAASLWLAIVGITSLDAQYPQIYNSLYPLLKDEVIRLCPPVESSTTLSMNGTALNGDDMSLYVETDYSLFLLRHWSLYQSMIHSSYLSAKLQLWTEDGRKKLHKLLAKMGIALQESKEQWAHMHIPVKRSLKEKLDSISGIYGIEEIIRQGVIRRYGFKGSVSAGDCVEALTALLEAGSGDILIHSATTAAISDSAMNSNGSGNSNSLENGDNTSNNDTTSTTTEHDEETARSDKERFWVSNFWVGWDALDNINMLLQGVSKAKILQQAIVATGTALFEKRQIKDLRTFRLAVIREGPDLELFTNPLALVRLGVWIAEGCAEVHPQPLPLVVASYNSARSIYLVLGMGPRKSRDIISDRNGEYYQQITIHNKFGTAFQTVANRINARVRIDAFESSIIEVSKDDLSRFLEALTLSGLR